MASKLERWVFVILPVAFLATALLAYSTFQRERTDGTLTSAIDRTTLMTRGIESQLVQAFAQVTSDFYGAAPIQGYEGLFEERILRGAGLVPRSGASKQICDEVTQKRLQTRTKAHILYSPFAFLPETYVMVQRIPLVTEPPFARDFPAAILMLPMTEAGDAAVQVIDCGGRIFMMPMSNAEGQNR